MATQDDHLLHLEDALLQRRNDDEYTGDGSVDYHGQPVQKTATGNWRACPFILGTECCERLAYYGIAKNLVNYLTSNMHESNVTAAKNVNGWAGTCYLTPLIGAYLADAYWGRYRTISVFSTIYFIGMLTLSISALVPALRPAECVGSVCPVATPAQNAIFFGGLYLMALGTGGIKPCVSTFGADQFDDTDPEERVKKGSFFNWFYFSINIGSLVSSSLIVWIQENVGWGIGFGIPALFMGVAITCFLSGTPLYRFQSPAGSPLTRMCRVIVASLQKRKLEVSYKNVLQVARELGLIDQNVAVPLSIFWQIPQFFLVGAAEVFTFIGQLEFFYDQSPDTMRSLCSALSLLTTAFGNYLSSLILTIVTSVTTAGGKPGWIPDNLNQGQLYNFFWLLAGLSLLNLLVYVFCAMNYKQKKTSKNA